jgi:adenylate cyclase
MKARFCRPLIIVLITFLLGSIVDYITDLETNLGLSTLFQLRGTRPPPADIVVVAMDEQSDINQTGG